MKPSSESEEWYDIQRYPRGKTKKSNAGVRSHGERSGGDFGHSWHIWCAGNSTWPLQLPFLLLALTLFLFCLHRCQNLQLLRNEVGRVRSAASSLQRKVVKSRKKNPTAFGESA